MKDLIAEQRKYFEIVRKDITGSDGLENAYVFRRSNLLRLRDGIIKHEKKLLEGLREDLGKSVFESVMAETSIVLSDISFTLKHLKKWMSPKKVPTPLAAMPAKSFLYPEPYGVALIISPWNYPVQLSLAPLVSSIAAGNCSVLKLSEFSPNSSAAVADMLKDTFQECYIAAVCGNAGSSEALLKEKFDYIFFTGSPRVGKLVMKAAAENLTPVTLELGGKSPCLVDISADLEMAAKRIVWGKLLNAGQTCIAPDYIMAHRDIRDKLIERMKHYIQVFYSGNPLANGAYPKMIHKNAFDRVVSLIDQSKTVYGGRYDEATLKIEPTIMTDVHGSDKVMEGEIFGPIFPVLKYDDISEAEDFINAHPKPLAFYIFTGDKKLAERLINRISFGGGCINDTVMHIASHYMPFGGVGNSGMGQYHGKYGFDTFSHTKGVMDRATFIDIPLRYHPAGNKLKYIRKIMG